MSKLTRDDLFSLEKYAEVRPEFRARVMAHKKNRQLPVGPNATLYFEDALTMHYQVQEMLRAERIFEADGIQEELDAYNPLIPQGTELTATVMFEIEDPIVRERFLDGLGGVDDDADRHFTGGDHLDVDIASGQGAEHLAGHPRVGTHTHPHHGDLGDLVVAGHLAGFDFLRDLVQHILRPGEVAATYGKRKVSGVVMRHVLHDHVDLDVGLADGAEDLVAA